MISDHCSSFAHLILSKAKSRVFNCEDNDCDNIVKYLNLTQIIIFFVAIKLVFLMK